MFKAGSIVLHCIYNYMSPFNEKGPVCKDLTDYKSAILNATNAERLSSSRSSEGQKPNLPLYGTQIRRISIQEKSVYRWSTAHARVLGK